MAAGAGMWWWEEWRRRGEGSGRPGGAVHQKQVLQAQVSVDDPVLLQVLQPVAELQEQEAHPPFVDLEAQTGGWWPSHTKSGSLVGHLPVMTTTQSCSWARGM